jgi:hypothetical protein
MSHPGNEFCGCFSLCQERHICLADREMIPSVYMFFGENGKNDPCGVLGVGNVAIAVALFGTPPDIDA